MTLSARSAFLAWVVIPAALAAQSDDAVPNVAALRAPATPAITLLGVSPSDVARPQTPGDLAVALITKGSVNGAPTDVALEVSPYWLLGHSSLTWRDDVHRSLGNSIARTLGVSLATTSDGTRAAPSTGLGLGFRAMLLSGRLSDTTIGMLAAVEANAAQQGHIFNKYRKSETDRIDALVSAELKPCLAIPNDDARLKCATDVAAKYQPVRDSVTRAVLANPDYQKEIAKAVKAIDNFALTREGWFWEIAGGSTWNFADGAWATGRHAHTGAWTTLSYEGGKIGDATTWTPVLVARWLQNDSSVRRRFADVGGRLVMSSPLYALSAEWVQRFATTKPGVNKGPDHRVSAMLEYRIADQLWLFAAMGKDYASAAKNSFISKFGVSVSFRKQRYNPKP